MPSDARVIDARGKYLIPGLWDMHIHPFHFAPIFYPLLVANGVTGIRDAWSNVPLDTLLHWRREILAGTRVGPPRQLLAGAPLHEDDPARAERLVDSLQAAGANFLKTYPLTFALAAAARHAGLPFGGHVKSQDAIAASDSGIRIVDHVTTSGGMDTLCVGPQASAARCRPVAERFRRNGTWWGPTILTHGLAFNPSRTKVRPGARSRAMAERFQAFAGRYWTGAAVPPSWLHDVADAGSVGVTATTTGETTDSLRFFAVAQRVGLPILAGTDTEALYDQQNCQHNPPGFSLLMELTLYVAEGLTPLEALQTATLNPAKLLHATDSLGTVDAGKLADLVLLDANPLDDITNLARVHGVVANGRYFDRAALDHLLAAAQVQGKQDFTWFGEMH
jgi:hypothetical protein